jgi:hypothetical protein
MWWINVLYCEVRSGDNSRYNHDSFFLLKTGFWLWLSYESHFLGCFFTIECTVNEEFSVKITDEEVKLLMDDSKEIRYEKVFQWCLPRYGADDDEHLFEFQAARMMRNSMRKQVVEDGFKPRYHTGGK